MLDLPPLYALPCMTCSCVFHWTYSLRQEEVAAMSGPDEFGEFYHRLRQIKDYHRKNPNEIEEPMQMEFLRMENERQKPSEELQSELRVVVVVSHFI